MSLEGHPKTRRADDPELAARAYRTEDEAAVVAMYEAAFGRPRTAADVARRLERGPGGPAVRRVVVSGEVVIAHRALVPLPAWVDGRREDVPITCDAMVVPEWQGRGVRPLLRHEFGPGTDTSADLGIYLLSEVGAVRMGRARDQERFPQWVRWHGVESLERSAGRSFPRGARLLVSVALRALPLVDRLPSLGVRVEVGRPADEELDDLAAASASFASRIHVRDAAYLRWRWPLDDDTWTVRHARGRDGALLGWVVSGRDPHRFGGAGVIGDLLAVSPRATSALVRRAADALAVDGAGIVTCAYRDPRPWARRAMVAAGFVDRGVAPPVVTRAYTERGEALRDISGWYLTTGELI